MHVWRDLSTSKSQKNNTISFHKFGGIMNIFVTESIKFAGKQRVQRLKERSSVMSLINGHVHQISHKRSFFVIPWQPECGVEKKLTIFL